ncbi:MAG: hypothetical protein K2M59_04840, partial [Muribaculaceae bacterium]|nr:hypothetical protein [Muribaculaceae bacterium]
FQSLSGLARNKLRTAAIFGKEPQQFQSLLGLARNKLRAAAIFRKEPQQSLGEGAGEIEAEGLRRVHPPYYL